MFREVESYEFESFKNLWREIQNNFLANNNLHILLKNYLVIKPRYKKLTGEKIVYQLNELNKLSISDEIKSFLSLLSSDIETGGHRLKDFIKKEAEDIDADDPESSFVEILENTCSKESKRAPLDLTFLNLRGNPLSIYEKVLVSWPVLESDEAKTRITEEDAFRIKFDEMAEEQYSLGIRYYSRKEFQLAEQYIKKAIELGSNHYKNVRFKVNLSWILVGCLKKYEEGFEILLETKHEFDKLPSSSKNKIENEIIVNFINCAVEYCNLGIQYISNNEVELGEKSIKRALELCTFISEESHLNIELSSKLYLGIALIQRNKCNEAMTILQGALDQFNHLNISMKNEEIFIKIGRQLKTYVEYIKRNYFNINYQPIIMQKLADFISLKKKLNPLEMDQEIFDANIQAFSTDFSYGFALCYSAMDSINQREWWEISLVAITRWDGREASLSLTIKDTKQTLTEIFERVMHYLIFSQSDLLQLKHSIAPIDKGICLYYPLHSRKQQMCSLRPDFESKSKNLSFEIMASDNKIQKIQHSDSIAGTFSPEDLALLLDENNLNKRIYLLQSYFNTITITYSPKDLTWILYNPKYNHASSETMHNIFPLTDKLLLCEEVLHILGRSIIITKSCYEENKEEKYVTTFPYFEELVRRKPLSLMENNGIQFISEVIPSYLPRLLNEALESKEDLTKFNSILSFNSQITKYLTDLQLLRLIFFIDKSKETQKSIPLLLAAESQTGSSGYELIVREDSTKLSQMLTLMVESKNVFSGLARKSGKKGWNGLHMIAYHVPHLVPKALALLESNKKACFFIREENNEQKTSLDFIKLYAPNTFRQLLLEEPEGLGIVAKYGNLPQVIKQISISNTIFVTMMYGLTSKNKFEESGLYLAMQYAPQALEDLLNRIAEVNNSAHFILDALVSIDKNNDIGIIKSDHKKIIIKAFIKSLKNANLEQLNHLLDKLSTTNYEFLFAREKERERTFCFFLTRSNSLGEEFQVILREKIAKHLSKEFKIK